MATRKTEIVLKATNIAEVTIDPKRAKVDCDAVVRLDSDGPIAVSLAGGSSPVKTVRSAAAP